jgi:hypothetical protein
MLLTEIKKVAGRIRYIEKNSMASLGITPVTFWLVA